MKCAYCQSKIYPGSRPESIDFPRPCRHVPSCPEFREEYVRGMKLDRDGEHPCQWCNEGDHEDCEQPCICGWCYLMGSQQEDGNPVEWSLSDGKWVTEDRSAMLRKYGKYNQWFLRELGWTQAEIDGES